MISVNKGEDTFLENKIEVRKIPLGVTGEGEETKRVKEKLSQNLTINALFMERCIAVFAEKITWHQQFPRRAEVKGEMSLASIILNAAAGMYQARRTPAAGSVSSAKDSTL